MSRPRSKRGEFGRSGPRGRRAPARRDGLEDRGGRCDFAGPGRARLLAVLVVTAALALAAPAGADPASRIGPGDSASEYWDLVARFDSGHYLFTRFLITNEGPGKLTGVANGQFVEADGTVRTWHNGRREANWELSPNGRKLDVGSSELDLDGEEWRLRVHKKKQGVDIELRFRPDSTTGFAVARKPSEVSADLLAQSAPIAGSVWFRDMARPVKLTGRVALTHTWMEAREGEVSLRRLDFFSLDAGPKLSLLTFEAPGGARAQWLRVEPDGGDAIEITDFQTNFRGHSTAESDPAYPIPESIELVGPSIKGKISLKSGLVHHDPMDEIPQPFRFLLSFSMRPHRVWAESPFEVTVGTGPDELQIRGMGVTSVTYLNPPPSPQRR